MKTCAQCGVNYPDAVACCPRDGTELPRPPETRSAEEALIGSTIDGRYIVESILGRGGMGYVYGARHAIIDKRVAIKVLRPDHAASDANAAQRFLAEAKAASKIGHQNIVDITDFGVLPSGHAYFVMEFLDGPTLGRLMRQAGHLPPRQAIAITIQIARGLQAAHEKGIIHRDLKPENVFVLERLGEERSYLVKIVDFGIARDASSKKRLTMAGMVLGTPEYMSPEQATGSPTDHRVDMYAVGCILYEMLTGKVPFRGDTPTKTLTSHAFDEVIPPSVRRQDLEIPSALEAVVLRALRKKPADRFADLRQLIGALEDVDRELAGKRSAPARRRRPVTTTATMQIETARAQKRHRRLLIGGGVALFLALAVGVGMAVTGRAPEPQPVAGASPTPERAEPSATVEIVLRTRPEGAEVREGATRIGLAPLRIERPRGEVPLVLSFHHAGYHEETRELIPNSDKDIEVVLERVAPSRRPEAAKAPAVAKPAPKPALRPERVSDLRNPFE